MNYISPTHLESLQLGMDNNIIQVITLLQEQFHSIYLTTIHPHHIVLNWGYGEFIKFMEIFYLNLKTTMKHQLYHKNMLNKPLNMF